MQKTIPIAKKDELVIQELDSELLIYDLQTNKVFSLNETSALVWQLSNGERTISEIAQIVGQNLGIKVSEEFVWLALEQMKKQNLLENKSVIENHFQGESRREVIKRVGYASLVTLPMISILVAPLAIQAQSGNNCSATVRPLGCTCSNSGNCLSFCCGLDGGGNRACIVAGTVPPGSPCAFSCNCISTASCGLGPVCVPNGSIAPGNPCRGAINCASGICNFPGICD
jgi:hypothetical protein